MASEGAVKSEEKEKEKETERAESKTYDMYVLYVLTVAGIMSCFSFVFYFGAVQLPTALSL